jgi:hypothetical protein
MRANRDALNTSPHFFDLARFGGEASGRNCRAHETAGRPR